jgi:hypothetical protein
MTTINCEISGMNRDKLIDVMVNEYGCPAYNFEGMVDEDVLAVFVEIQISTGFGFHQVEGMSLKGTDVEYEI